MPLEQRRRVDLGPLLAILVFGGGLFGLYWYMTTHGAAVNPDGAAAETEPTTATPDESEAAAEPGPKAPTVATGAAGARLRVRVQDGAGVPVAGATVQVLRQVVYRSAAGWSAFDPSAAFPPAISAEDGAVAFVSPGTLAGAHVLAFKGSTAARTRGLYVSENKERDVALELVARSGLELLVTGGGEEPLDGATARLVVPLPKASRLSPGSIGLVVEPLSAQQGRFLFPPIPRAGEGDDAETELHVHATAPGHLPSVFDLPFDPADGEPVRLALVRSVTVRGRLVRAEDEPVARAHIVFEPTEEYPLLGRKTVTTDHEGAFTFAGLPATGGELLVDAGALLPVSVTFPAAETSEVALGDVLVETGGSIAGRVIDTEGNACAKAHVFVATPGGAGALRDDETDQEGRFTLRDAGVGKHRLFAREGGLPRGWEPRSGMVENTAAGDHEVEIVLTAERLLRIELAFAEGHEPPRKGPSIRIAVTPNGAELAQPEEHFFRDVKSVRVRCAQAGPHRVEVEIEGYVPVGVDVDVLTDAEATCSVELRRAPIEAPIEEE